MGVIQTLHNKNRKLKFIIIAISIIAILSITFVIIQSKGKEDSETESAHTYNKSEDLISAFSNFIRLDQFNFVPPLFSANFFLETGYTEEMLYRELRESFENVKGDYGLESLDQVDSTHANALLVRKESSENDGVQSHPTVTLNLLLEKDSWKINQYSHGSKVATEASGPINEPLDADQTTSESDANPSANSTASELGTDQPKNETGDTGPLTESLEDHKQARGAAEALSEEGEQFLQVLKLMNEGDTDNKLIHNFFDKPVTNKEALQKLAEDFSPFDLSSAVEIDYPFGFFIYVLDRNGKYHSVSLSFEPLQITEWELPVNWDQDVMTSLYK